jgi:hypothetical protein
MAADLVARYEAARVAEVEEARAWCERANAMLKHAKAGQ